MININKLIEGFQKHIEKISNLMKNVDSNSLNVENFMNKAKVVIKDCSMLIE